MTNTYGDFELTIGVPDDYEGHRCKYARKYLREHLGSELVQALVIQRAIPDQPRDAEEGKTYYRFGGNIIMSRVVKDE